MKISTVSFLLLLPSLACTAAQVLDDVKPTKFIEYPERLVKPKYTPFDLGWMAPDAGTRQYDKLIVQAVRTDDLRTDNWLFRAGTLIPTRDSYLEKVDELAIYIQNTVIEKFEDYEDKGEGVVVEQGAPVQSLPIRADSDPLVQRSPADTPTATAIGTLLPNSRTLGVEIAITEANFGDPVVYGGLLAVPLPGIANLSTAAKSPSLTLEARLIDMDSGEVVTELLDRRFPQVKIVDINRLTISSALRELADSFAEDLVDSFYRKKGEKIGRRSPFSLLPW